MSDPFLAMITPFGGNFAPRGWAMCQGQIMNVSQNAALFALLGTAYGGNGQSTFALPNLCGRTVIGTGTGPGLPNYVWAQIGGNYQTTLTTSNMPTHTHTASFVSSSSLNVAITDGTNEQPGSPNAFMLARSVDDSGDASPLIYAPNNQTTVALGGLNVAGTVPVGTAGGSQPFSAMPPYLAMTMIIAVQGTYPSRN